MSTRLITLVLFALACGGKPTEPRSSGAASSSGTMADDGVMQLSVDDRISKAAALLNRYETTLTRKNLVRFAIHVKECL